MSIIDRYNCILCKYNKYNKSGGSCWDYQEKDELGYQIGECRSLSNIYYGTLIKFSPFKQIDWIKSEIAYKKENKYYEEMTQKYGNYGFETDELKFIWGVKSWDDLCKSDACLETMNDIDIIYDKKKKEYMLGIETAYNFEDYNSECDYLKNCLNAFTKYMDDNNLDKNKKIMLFMANPTTEITADSIEELYTNFRIFVNGYCSLA